MKRFPAVLIFVCATLVASWSTADLKAYVNRPDDSFAFEIVERNREGDLDILTVRLTSQTWQGIVWQHWMSIIRPVTTQHPDKGMLFIGGGSNNSPQPTLSSGQDRAIVMVAQATGATAVILRQVPNQPLFADLNEDALIAFTYENYLEGRGDDWPVLFPMVKSAVRAMDATQSITEAEYGKRVDQFLVTGGSKRGWTTWLAAVVDPRIERIAPMIIDMLNTREQMRHQQRSYGGYTESIGDYTQRELQDRMLAGEGDPLLAQVDPWSWREKLTLPKLVVLGTNDPYWTVDAANFYFDDLEGRKYLYYQANTGHDAALSGVATVTQFLREMLTGEPFPEITWRAGEGMLTVEWERDGGQALLWQAHSSNRDFRQAQWTSSPLEGDKRATAPLTVPEGGWRALYVEVTWPSPDGFPFGVTTRMYVLPENNFPKLGERAYDPVTE